MDRTDALDCGDDLEMTKHALHDCYASYRFSDSFGKLMLLNATLGHLLRLNLVYASFGRQWGRWMKRTNAVILSRNQIVNLAHKFEDDPREQILF